MPRDDHLIKPWKKHHTIVLIHPVSKDSLFQRFLWQTALALQIGLHYSPRIVADGGACLGKRGPSQRWRDKNLGWWKAIDSQAAAATLFSPPSSVAAVGKLVGFCSSEAESGAQLLSQSERASTVL